MCNEFHIGSTIYVSHYPMVHASLPKILSVDDLNTNSSSPLHQSALHRGRCHIDPQCRRSLNHMLGCCASGAGGWGGGGWGDVWLRNVWGDGASTSVHARTHLIAGGPLASKSTAPTPWQHQEHLLLSSRPHPGAQSARNGKHASTKKIVNLPIIDKTLQQFGAAKKTNFYGLQLAKATLLLSHSLHRHAKTECRPY